MKKICVGIFFVLAALNGYSNDLVIGIDNSYPPYMHGEGENVKGLYPLILSKIFSKMDTQPLLKAKPWKRIIMESKISKLGVGGIYKNEERLKVYDYSNPFFEETLVLYVNAWKKNKTFESMNDLKGMNLGLMRGWSYGEEVDKARKEEIFKVTELGSAEQIFKMIEKKRLDGVIIDSVSAKMILEKLKLEDKFVVLGEPVAKNEAFIVFHKDMDKTDLIKKFNKALAELKESGEYEKIISDFFKDQK